MRTLRLPTTLAAAVCLLAACGGSGERTDVTSTDKEPPVSATLVDDEGQAMPALAAAVPADPAARTRAGRYATAGQARALEQALGDAVLHVQLDGSDAVALELALQLAHGEQAAKDLPRQAPVFVQGPDLRLAAVAAERMAAAGHDNVWLVTR